MVVELRFHQFCLLFKDKSVKTSTMQRVEERDKKKMETLKKKLHTDDESKGIVWACEQGRGI